MYKEDSDLLEELLTTISVLMDALENVEEDSLAGMYVHTQYVCTYIHFILMKSLPLSLADLPSLDQEVWPDMQSLKTQFDQRSTVVVTSDLDRRCVCV